MNTMEPSGPSLLAGGLPCILWFLMTCGMIAGWIIFLIAAWRAMKAHESIARSMQQIADKPN